jgi:histidine ammonia-lyase
VDAFDRKVQLLRHHLGQEKCANNIRRCTKNSQLTTKPNEIKVQDSYSLRCLPQIHGASKDAIDYVKEKVLFEINAVTDNPLIFVDCDEVISSGNFHGQPMALAFDFLGIALSEMANASERRIERLVNPSLSGLPAFLTEKGGTNSGFMIMQYTAASLVSENKVLAHPASVDSIPSSGNQEDHVSMGTIAANKAYEICKNLQYVLSIEYLTAAQGLDFHQPTTCGNGTQVAYDLIRRHVSHVTEDRFMAPDIEAARKLILSHQLVDVVEAVVGQLE